MDSFRVDKNHRIGTSKPLAIVVVLSLTAILCPAVSFAIEIDMIIDHVIRFEPQPENKTFSPRLKPLWLEAFARPEADLQRQAADAFAEAHQRGMTGLEEIVPQLIEKLQDPKCHQTVALAVARVLIVLDARDAAPALAERVDSDGLDMALLVEPVLAQWNYQPMRTVWGKRLANPQTKQHLMVLAINAVATIDERRAAAPLLRMALDRRTAPDLRIDAARSAGQIQDEGFTSDVMRLIDKKSSPTLVDRLVGASLLRHHGGETAEKVLLQLATDPSPTVAAVAVQRLLEIDPLLVRDINEQLVASPDSGVRQLAAKCLLGQRLPASVALLGKLLDDPHPKVRTFAGDALAQLDKVDELSQPVREAATKMLASDRPWGLEQAVLVVGQLDHEPVSERLVELLDHPASNVYIAAAWALRQLALPTTAKSILEKVNRETEKSIAIDKLLWKTWMTEDRPELNMDTLFQQFDQVNHLIEALGILGFEECESLMRTYLPTPPPRGLLDPPAVATIQQPKLRSAAIWTLARIHEGHADVDLADTFIDHLQKTQSGFPAEWPMTRAVMGYALAEMDAKQHAPRLRKLRDGENPHSIAGATFGRALQKLAGDLLPAPVPRNVEQVNWFIEPLNK